MNRLKEVRFYYAIYKSFEFILVDNDDDKTTEWELFSSLKYDNDVQKAKEMNFRPLPIGDRYTVESYYLPITPSELDSAYSIENYCEYNGDVLKCAYSEERRTFSVELGENEELCRRYGIGDVYDRYIGSRGYECYNDLWIVVPEDEVLDVWEQRSPIKGFPFHGPEKVYVRKDGVWLR